MKQNYHLKMINGSFGFRIEIAVRGCCGEVSMEQYKKALANDQVLDKNKHEIKCKFKHNYKEDNNYTLIINQKSNYDNNAYVYKTFLCNMPFHNCPIINQLLEHTHILPDIVKLVMRFLTPDITVRKVHQLLAE